MLSSDTLNIIINIFYGISIIAAVVPLIGVLLVRYSKNHHLVALYYTCVLFVAPWYASGYGSRGFAYLELKEFDKTMKDCNRALKLNSDLYWVYNNRGMVHMHAKRYKEALLDFERSIKLKRDYVLPYINSMYVSLKFKNYKQALMHVEAYTTVKGNIQDAAILCTRGAIYAYLKDYTRALQDCNRSLELKPDFAPSHHNKGFDLLMLNQVQQGFEAITRAYTLEPRNILLNWTFEWCKMYMERPDTTTAARLETLAKLEPENHIAYVSRGVASWLRGSFEVAVKELEQAIALAPYSPEGYFWVGVAYASMGHDEEALVALQEAQEIGVPRVLMTPLYLLEQTQPTFFKRYATKFLATQTHVFND